MVADNKMLG